MEVTNRTAADFFAYLLPNYIEGPARVEVELIDSAPGVPYKAAVGWDAGANCYRILIGRDSDTSRFFLTLWHEAGHILNGDSSTSQRIDWDAERAAMRGEMKPPAVELRKEAIRGIQGGSRETPKEKSADSWGVRMWSKWYTILHSATDLESAKDAARWVLRNIGKDYKPN